MSSQEVITAPLLEGSGRCSSDPIRKSSKKPVEMTEVVSEENVDTETHNRYKKDKKKKKGVTWSGSKSHLDREPERPITQHYNIQQSMVSSSTYSPTHYQSGAPNSPTGHYGSYHSITQCDAGIQEQYEQEGFNMAINRPHINSQGGQSEGIIDGRSFSMSINGGNDDFVSVEAISGGDLSTTKALEKCNKYVLKPYNTFLKVIGWRAFRTPQKDSIPWYKKFLNVVYPLFIFVMLLLTCAAQIGSCFSRGRSAPTIPLTNGENRTLLSCCDDVATGSVFPDILLLLAYLWALYIFRFTETEHLSTLIETVFLSYNSRFVMHSQRSLVNVLLTFLFVGATWIVISALISIVRLFALDLQKPNTIIGWYYDEESRSLRLSSATYDVIHYGLVIFSYLGFVFFDMLYVAVILNYSTQCQLLHFYVRNIKEKVRNKAYLLGDAVKEIYHIYEFLNVLNGNLSLITTLIFFIFTQNVITSYRNLQQVESHNYLGIVVGILNICQWLFSAMIPLIQAARVTAECQGLKKLGIELGARPFVYSDTPQLVLDSFVLYTNATNYRAKLALIPIYANYIIAFWLVFIIIFTQNTYLSDFKFAKWF